MRILEIIKKRYISKTKRIWADIFGGKIRNPWEISDSPQLQGWEVQITKENFITISEFYFLKKSQKTSYLKNYKDLSSHNWRQGSQHLRKLWHPTNYRVGKFKIWKKNNYFLFSETFLKNHKKRQISKTTRTWAVYLEARLATPKSTLEAPNYGARNFKLWRKKISLWFQNFFGSKTRNP